MFTNLLDPEERGHRAANEKPPEVAYKGAQAHDHARGQRQRDAETGKQVGENGNDPLQKRADDQHGDGHNRDRVDQSRLNRGAQAHSFFDILRQALQDDVENTASLARLDHVGSEVIENRWILAHGIGQGGSALHRGTHAVQRFLERGVLLVGRKNFQTLHQRQSGIDHDRELPEEDGDVLGLDLPGSERGKGKLLTLFAHRTGRDALTAQLLQQHILVGGYPFSSDLLARCTLSRKCKDWHSDCLLDS